MKNEGYRVDLNDNDNGDVEAQQNVELGVVLENREMKHEGLPTFCIEN